MTTVERFAALRYLASKVKDELVVSWIGVHEWPELTNYREENLTIGHMGTSVPLALGLAKALPKRKVICLAGDGDLLLEIGVLPSLGKENPENLVVIVNDNEVYQSAGRISVGYFPTFTKDVVDLASMAKACGVGDSVTVRSLDEFKREVDQALSKPGLRFIVAKTDPQPYQKPLTIMDGMEVKYRFVRYIERSEGLKILPRLTPK